MIEMSIEIREFSTGLFSKKAVETEQVAFSLRWLGQAGFELYTPELHLLIDPYLSDHLAKKYAGKEFAHQRLMPPPIPAEEIRELDYLLCSHRHSDHLDPVAVPLILANNPRAIMIAPRAEQNYIINTLGIDRARLRLSNAGEVLRLSADTSVRIIPSSHESIEVDSAGNQYYLGYILSSRGVTIYHSGDCVPYAGLSKLLRDYKVDVALLPINGRDEYRASRGVPGNMSFSEALELCEQAGINTLICQHFGMFAFNTADMAEVAAELERRKPLQELKVIIPKSTVGYLLNSIS